MVVLLSWMDLEDLLMWNYSVEFDSIFPRKKTFVRKAKNCSLIYNGSFENLSNMFSIGKSFIGGIGDELNHLLLDILSIASLFQMTFIGKLLTKILYST